jgi:hypothetical protein
MFTATPLLELPSSSTSLIPNIYSPQILEYNWLSVFRSYFKSFANTSCILFTINAGKFIALSQIKREHLFLRIYVGFLLPTKFIFLDYIDFTTFYNNFFTSLFPLGSMLMMPLHTFYSSSSCCCSS